LGEYVECPAVYTGKKPSVFLAGTISGARDWQREIAAMLLAQDFAVLNPRRTIPPGAKRENSEAQILWEHEHIQKATVVSFWFSNETLAPITLFELGKTSAIGRSVLVGVDPRYERKIDVEIQLKLIRPDVNICYSLESLAQQVIQLLKDFGGSK
jgi:hypothetical protein